MTYSSSDLQSHVDELLDELGYQIIGDDGEGWAWRVGGAEVLSVTGLHGPIFDSAAEATAAALQELVGCVDDLRGTGRTVVERWESGDLAEAVRELDGALCMLDPALPASSTDRVNARPADDSGRREARLRRLMIEGLTLDDCLKAFGSPSVKLAQLRTSSALQGLDVLIGEHTVVREDLGEPGNTHALAWLRVNRA